jgi:hypothetical protein
MLMCVQQPAQHLPAVQARGTLTFKGNAVTNVKQWDALGWRRCIATHSLLFRPIAQVQSMILVVDGVSI